MSTISNQASVNLKTPHTSNAEELRSNQEIPNNHKPKIYWFSNIIEKLHISLKHNEPKNDFHTTVIDLSNQKQTSPEKMDNSAVFCFETYKQKREEHAKKFDEEKAKWKTPQKAFFDGAKLGLLLGFSIFIAKKIIASSIITNLIQYNQSFFKK